MIWRSHDYCSYAGPQAREIFGVCRPDPSAGADTFSQLEPLYRRLGEILAADGGLLSPVVSPVTCLTDPGDAGCLQSVLAANGLAGVPNAALRAAICRPKPLCEVEAVAVLPPAGIDPEDRTP